MKLLRNAKVFAPEPLGVVDILIYGEHVVAVGAKLDVARALVDEEIDLRGATVVPGFIDQHVHILGGGGGAGPSSRVPEIAVTDATMCGTTTLVGCLGMDCTARHMPDVLSKARALTGEGITAFIYTGGCVHPLPNITGGIRSDIYFITECLGAGEVPISDLGSVWDSMEEEPIYLAHIGAEARMGGKLTGKAGVVALHLGDGPKGLSPIFRVLDKTGLSIHTFVPTHINRNDNVFHQAIEYAKRGGTIDLTASRHPEAGFKGSRKAAPAIKELLGKGVPIDQITMSTDGNGSMAVTNEKGDLVAALYHPLKALHAEFRDLVKEEGLAIQEALKPITTNPAGVLRLKTKGRVRADGDADLVVLDDDLKVRDVWARGRLMVRGGKALVRGFNQWDVLRGL